MAWFAALTKYSQAFLAVYLSGMFFKEISKLDQEAENIRYLIQLSDTAGLSVLDVLLLTLCPIATMLGTMVSNAVNKIVNKPEYVPESQLPAHIAAEYEEGSEKELMLAKHNFEKKRYYEELIYRSKRADSLRLPFVGLVLGLVIALYFVGAITNDVTSLARILGLCVLLGYQAPNLWLSQEKVIKDLVDKKIGNVLSSKNITSSLSGTSNSADASSKAP